MRIKKDTPVKLKTFLGKIFSKEYENTEDDYWKLIGLCGIVIGEDGGKVLVKFNDNLNNYNVANHNPIKNTLWINKSDLEIDRFGIYIKKLNNELQNFTSLMNNTKWYKLFTALLDNGMNSVSIKFLLEDHIHSFYLGVSSFNENGFADGAVAGPFEYRELEWIKIFEITERINGILHIKIGIDEIEKKINSIGKLEYEKESDGIKIY